MELVKMTILQVLQARRVWRQVKPGKLACCILPRDDPGMAWFYILLAGICEMVWPIGFKYTDGFKTNYGLMAITLMIMTLSFALMSIGTAKGIHVGTAYAVWTGIGAGGTAILGMIMFREPHDLFRLLCIMLIILGAAGLKLRAPEPSTQKTHSLP
jgi:quaternary ammonium compound-resistance protein SugE